MVVVLPQPVGPAKSISPLGLSRHPFDRLQLLGLHSQFVQRLTSTLPVENSQTNIFTVKAANTIDSQVDAIVVFLVEEPSVLRPHLVRQIHIGSRLN